MIEIIEHSINKEASDYPHPVKPRENEYCYSSAIDYAFMAEKPVEAEHLAGGGSIINAESIARIESFLASTVSEVFQSYGLYPKAAEVEEGVIQEPFASSIGFTSDRLPGALVLIASRSVVEASLPANLKASPIDEEILADWTGELSNQLLGRLKSRFCAAGVDITLSTPTVFTGKDLHHFSRQSDLLRRLSFECRGTLLVEFQADFDSDFELGEGTDESSVAGGEAIFF